MILAEQQLDEARIAAFLVQKASARNIQVSKRAFREDEIRSRARENYADLQRVFTIKVERLFACKLLHANEVCDARAVFCA